jgi:DNA repair photolyase
VDLSIGTLDRDVWRLTEPGTPPPDRRVEAVRRLNAAGIPCGVLVAPVLPGLSDGEDQLRDVVAACLEAGATSVSAVALHLRPGVKEHYLGWLDRTRPDLADLHRRRFGGRAYQSKDEQARLTNLVGSLVDEARRDGPARRGENRHGAPFPTGHDVARHPAAQRPAPEGEQLRLL